MLPLLSSDLSTVVKKVPTIKRAGPDQPVADAIVVFQIGNILEPSAIQQTSAKRFAISRTTSVIMIGNATRATFNRRSPLARPTRTSKQSFGAIFREVSISRYRGLCSSGAWGCVRAFLLPLPASGERVGGEGASPQGRTGGERKCLSAKLKLVERPPHLEFARRARKFRPLHSPSNGSGLWPAR